MFLNHIQKSLRFKLLLPISLLLIGAFTGLGIAVVQVQHTLLSDMRAHVKSDLAASDEALKDELAQLESDLKATMAEMSQQAATALNDKIRQAFETEAAGARQEAERFLTDKANTILDLLVKVAPQAILHNRIGDLIKFAKSAESNPDVIYALFMRPDGRPYTPLMNAREPHIKAYIDQGTGKTKQAKLMSGSRNDPLVMILSKPIVQQGESLGEVVIGMSRSSAAARNDAMNTRLTTMVAANKADIDAVMADKTHLVMDRLDHSGDAIAQKNQAVIETTATTLTMASHAVGARTGQVMLIAGGTSAAIVLFGVGFLVVFLMIHPLDKVVANLKAIAQGEADLTTRLVVKSRDEMGRLAHWFNTFMASLQAIIKEVTLKAETVSVSAGSLNHLSRQMSSGTENVSAKSDSVSQSAQEMSASLNTVAAASEEATTNMGMVAATVEEMSATIGEIAQNAEQARTVVSTAVAQSGRASSQVNKLDAAALQISKVTEVITEISEQTNLLALNATIEAARAGDAGKGFAVVAHEIKELAAQTAKATQDIKARIEEIQETTEVTVADIAGTAKEIEGVNAIVTTIATAVEEQSSSTRDIAGNLSQASTGVEEINTNIAQCNLVAANMADEVAAVNTVTDDISEGSVKVNTSAEELAHLSGELKELISGFKV